MIRKLLNTATRLSLLIMFFAAPVASQELGIRETVWGFDGTMQKRQFSPVSILLDNRSDKPFEGDVSLQANSGPAQSVGAKFVEPGVYIAPTGTRWVTFYPYVTEELDQLNWTLDYGTGSTRLEAVRSGKPATVMLTSQDSMSSVGKARRFPEEIFPPTSAATGGLKSVLLDHMPRWEKARQRAFMDWVRGGGNVHLLRNGENEFPTLTGELSELNSPLQVFPFHDGVVFRDERSGEVNREFLRQIAQNEERFRGIEKTDIDKALVGKAKYGSINLTNVINSKLKRMTQPEHNWALIYLLSFGYILLIFPGCYLLGRRRVHYLITYGAILGAAALFSLAFLIVGRRGYGEETKINSVAIAQDYHNGEWDVMQWSNAFATSGRVYDLDHAGRRSVYATGQSFESVRGFVARGEGADGTVDRQLKVEIPPFSDRSFLHRSRLSFPSLDIVVQELDIREGLSGLSIAYGKDAPPILSAYVLYKNEVHTLINERKSRTLRLGGGAISLAEFADYSNLQIQSSQFGFGVETEPDPEKLYQELIGPLAVYLSTTSSQHHPTSNIPALLIYTDLPKEFESIGDAFPVNTGRVLFVQKLKKATSNE